MRIDEQHDVDLFHNVSAHTLQRLPSTPVGRGFHKHIYHFKYAVIVTSFVSAAVDACICDQANEEEEGQTFLKLGGKNHTTKKNLRWKAKKQNATENDFNRLCTLPLQCDRATWPRSGEQTGSEGSVEDPEGFGLRAIDLKTGPQLQPGPEICAWEPEPLAVCQCVS